MADEPLGRLPLAYTYRLLLADAATEAHGLSEAKAPPLVLIAHGGRAAPEGTTPVFPEAPTP